MNTHETERRRSKRAIHTHTHTYSFTSFFKPFHSFTFMTKRTMVLIKIDAWFIFEWKAGGEWGTFNVFNNSWGIWLYRERKLEKASQVITVEMINDPESTLKRTFFYCECVTSLELLMTNVTLEVATRMSSTQNNKKKGKQHETKNKSQTLDAKYCNRKYRTKDKFYRLTRHCVQYSWKCTENWATKSIHRLN